MAIEEAHVMELMQLEAYAAIMAKHKLSKLTVQGCMLEMSPLGFSMPEVTQDKISQPQGGPEGYPTNDELMLWSAGGPLPETQANKKEPEGTK